MIGMTNIRILRNEVQETESFKKLSPVLKRIASSRNQIAAISHGFNVSMNIGLEKWEQQSNSSWWAKEIIKELINKRQ